MKVRVGIIGCGRIAQRFHIKSLFQSPNHQLVALCDERVEIAQELAQRYHVKKVFKDYRELLLNEEVDAVVISTPPESHFDIIKASALAKKHVFVEKPLTNTVEECKEAIKLCEDNKVKLMVGFMRRFDKALAWSKEKIASGDVGKVFVINSTYNLVATYGEYLRTTDSEIVGKLTPSQSYKENMHGFLINNLVHHADLIGWMAGSTTSLLASGIFESDYFTLNVLLKLEDGAMSQIQFNGFVKTDWQESLVIHGSKGSLFVELFFPYLTTPSHAVFVSSGLGQRFSPLLATNTMYKDELLYFLACIDSDSKPQPSAFEALESQLIVAAIEKSLKEQTWVSLDGA